MGSNCCKGDAAGKPVVRSTSSIYSRRHAGATLGDRFSTSQDSRGVRLTISAATTDDSGVYTLQASNAAGTDTTRVRLEVSPEDMPSGDDPPTFLRRLHDLTVKVGTRTRFLVEIISSSECRVTWYRNERRLLEAERIALVRDGNFWCADIAAVSVDDAGRWTCTAENIGGRASCSAHLNVLVPKAYKRPEFVEELRALLTEQGTVSLECKVVGVPTPVLRWFKDSREIKAGDVFALTANAEDPTSLGTYTCEAVNCMGRAYSSSKVHVVGHASKESLKPSFGGAQEPPPIFTKELEDRLVRICERLNLGCHIVVPPWPRAVVWYNKEGKIEPSERYHVLEDGVGGYMMEVPSAEYCDEGEWKCVATSAGGRVGISTCYVSMEVPKNYRKPRFMENLQAILTEEGLVSFECKVVGFPTPVLSWFKDGQELKPGDVYQLTGTNSLGSYCCIARNCMGQASSSAELSVEDIQNQLNEEEKLQLFTRNQAPKFLQGLKSVEAKIDEPFRFTVKVAIPPEPSVLWYRDDQPVDETSRCHLGKEDHGVFFLDIQNLELLDQAEWKCVAMNDFGHSVTSCFLKLIIPRHYKKPRFLENLQAILSDEGAVNLECKVIGVPQPVLKWYKDGEELKPGDIHRIISGQDGTCCLGNYTCEARNCMGIAASSASLLGFEDSIKNSKKKTEEQTLQRNLSLSTIHEERTSQMYDTPVGDITLDDKGEISFSFDGKEVSVSLYETPDLTEEEALQIVEMYADQLSENVTEHNVVELPPLRFVKETSTSGNLLMEAIIIDVSPEYFITPDEDLRTEADIDDISIVDENAVPQLSLDPDISREDYLEKTMALLSDEKADIPKKISRKKSDSQKSIDDFYSLSRDQSISESKQEDDTQPISDSFASAHSLDKAKSKSFKPSMEEGQGSSDATKTVLLKEELSASQKESTKIRRRTSSSRRSSSGSDKSLGKSRDKIDDKNLETKTFESDEIMKRTNELKPLLSNISLSLTNVLNDVQLIEKDIIVRSQLMSSTSAASRSLEIINSIITPTNEILCIVDAMKETMSENTDNVTKLDDKLLLNTLPSALESLQQSLTVLEKCIEVESENKTLVQKTCISFVKKCGGQMTSSMELFQQLVANELIKVDEICVTKISIQSSKIKQAMYSAIETVEKKQVKIESKEGKLVDNVELKHLNETQKALHELRIPVNLLSYIIENSLVSKSVDLYGVNYNEVILNNMSTSVQDLQNALEYVDNLALKESSTNLQKYNTEIIDRVMDSVLKLRTSFEQLSTITNRTEENNELFEVLSEIKLNLSDISIHLDEMEEKIGIFDVITNENKLEVLQKVAQVLISLENNLLLLEPIPEVQASMTIFHSNLTKVLENVIESNNMKKYFTLMEVSAVVNRINASLKNVDSDNKLCLIGIIDALKIIQANVTKNIFTQELNTMLISNIGDIIINIQKTINKAESTHLQDKVEHTDDMVTDQCSESKATVIIEHIEKAVAAINNIISLESTTDLIFKEALENVNPVLENLKLCIAASQLNKSESEQILQLPVYSEEPSIAKPLYDLQENISVLSQLISENVETYSSCELKRSFAESLIELNSAIEILQQDVNSQAGDSIDIQEISSCLANVVQSIRSCILIIREHGEIEMTDDLSTLEDISGIKTTAESLPVDHLILPSTEENTLGQSVQTITSLPDPTKEIAEELLKLNDHIMVVHNPQIMEVLDSLSEDDKYASLKSVMPSLKELHQSIEGNIPPVLLESCEDLSKTIDMQNLINIVQPLQHLQQSLCVVDASNIPISESVLQIPTDQLYMARSSLLELKNSLENCLSLLIPTISRTDETVDVSNKLYNLREKVKKILQIVENESILPTNFSINVLFLKRVLENFLEISSTCIDNAALKNSIEALYEALNKFEDEILGYVSSDTLSLNEIVIIESLHEVEKNIAILEEHSFIDYSIAKDFESSLVPMKATALEVDSLRQAENIKENIVHVIQDSINNLPKEDIESLERFFKSIKNKVLLLNCLIQKHPTHKRIIRLIQDSFSLNKEIKEFENNLQDQALTDETNTCMSKFLLQSQEFLATIRLLLLNVVDTESNLLMTIPLSNINSSIEWYSYILSSKEHVPIHELIKMLVSLSHLTLPLLSDLQSSIISEINTFSECEFECDSEINRILFEIKALIMNRLQECQLDEVPNNIYHNLIILLEKHEAYKKSTNIGKKLIIIKFLSECYKIIHNICTPEEKQISILDLREKPLKEILFEMKKPLDDLHNELINIQEQVFYNVDKDDSMSIDISSSESYVQALSEINEAIESHLKDKDLKINDEDMGLVKQIDDELHSIQSDLLSMEHINTVENLLIPLTEIEKSFTNILSIKTESEEGNNISNRGESKHDESVSTVTVYAVDEDGKQPEKEQSKVNQVIPEPEKFQEMKVLEDEAETIYDLEFSGKSQDEKSCTEQSLVVHIGQFVDVVEQTKAGVVQLNRQLAESYPEEPKHGETVITEMISEVEVSTIQLNVDQSDIIELYEQENTLDLVQERGTLEAPTGVEMTVIEAHTVDDLANNTSEQTKSKEEQEHEKETYNEEFKHDENVSVAEVPSQQLSQKHGTVQTLLQHIEQYVDVIQHLKEELVPLNIKLEDLQRTEQTATELRKSLAITEVIATDSSDTFVQNISPTQSHLAQELKEALKAIQIQSPSKEEYLNTAENENYMKVAKVIEELQDDLAIITTITEHKVIEDTETNKVSDEIKSLDKPKQEKETEALSEESTGDQTTKAETVSEEEVFPIEQLNQEQSKVQTLLQHIEQYIDVIEHSKEALIPLNIKLEDLQRTEQSATELRKSLTITEVIATDLLSDTSVQNISPTQARLAQELKEALEAIQIQSLGKEEYFNTAEKENYMKVAKVIEQLQDDLAAITAITEHKVIQDTETNKVSEEIKSLDKPEQEKEAEALSEESTGDQTTKAETVSKEQVVPKEQLNQEQSAVQQVEKVVQTTLNEQETNVRKSDATSDIENVNEGLDQGPDAIAVITTEVTPSRKEEDKGRGILEPLNDEAVKSCTVPEIVKEKEASLVPEETAIEVTAGPIQPTSRKKEDDLTEELSESVVSESSLNYSEAKRPEIEKNTFQALLQHIEQYVELTQSAEEITLSNVRQDDLKQIGIIANELRESIAASEIVTDYLEKEISIENITPEQAQLAQKLQIALETIHVQSISNEHELLLKDANQEPQVATVIEELRKDLTMISEITVIDDSLNNNTIQDLNSSNVTVVPDLQATRNEEETLGKYETTQEMSQNIKELDTKTVTETEIADDVAATSVSVPVTKEANIIKILKEFTSDDNIKDVRKLSPTIFEELKRTSDIAKTMLDSIIDVQKTSTIENKSIHSFQMLKKHTKKLSDSINSLHGVIISEVEQNNSIKESDTMKKIVKSIIALKIEISSAPGDLDIEVRCEQETLLHETGEQSLKKLEILLHEIKEQINTHLTEVSIERQEALNIILEEVQILIIKLKQDYDECKNDTLNETLEDLECSVRSVQLQLVENGPVDLLKEACLTLISLVSNIYETEATPAADVNIWIENVLRDCIKDIEETTILLSNLNPNKMHNKLGTVASNLKNIIDNMLSLKVLFSADVNVLIDKGVDIIQTFNQIEDMVFRLDKELESVQDIKLETQESITSATHSIYMSLSNMRSSLNSIQKQYMYEHYGRPCEHFLRLLKQISVLTNIDDRHHWKILAKSLRQVLNHFEDIKFYINFDKTARLPNDAAFTKVILDNLQTTLYDLLFVSKFDLDLDIDKSLLSTLTFAEQTLINLEGKSVIEVREKIPIFCELSQNVLLLSNSLNNIVKEIVEHNTTSRIVKKVRDDKKDAPNIPISNDNKVENIETESVLATQEQEPKTEIDKNINASENQKLDIAEAKSENVDITFLKQEVGSSELTNVLKITDAEKDKDIIEQTIAKNATNDQTRDDGNKEHQMIHEPLSEKNVERLPGDDLSSDKDRSQDASKEQKQVLNEEQKESGHEATRENKGDESFVSKQDIASGSQEEINVEKRKEKSSSSKTPIRSKICDIKEQQQQESPIEKLDTKNKDKEKVVDISIQKNKEKSGIINDETQVEESEKLGSPQTVPEKVEVTLMNQEHEYLHETQRTDETLCKVNEEATKSQETLVVLDRLISDGEKEINQVTEKKLESDVVIEKNKIDSEIIDNLLQITQTNSDIQEQQPKKQEEKQLIVDTSYEGEKVSNEKTGEIKPSKSSQIEEVLLPPAKADIVAKEINRDDDKNIESNTLDQNVAEIEIKIASENKEKYNNDDELLKSLPLKTPENVCIAVSTLQPKPELDSSQSILVQNVDILQHNEPTKQAPDDSPKGTVEEKIKIPETIVPETAQDDGNQKLLKENAIEKNKTDSPSEVTIENEERKLQEQTKATAEKQKEDSIKSKSVQDVQVDKRKEIKKKNKNQEKYFSEEASSNKSLTKESSTESKPSTTSTKQSESEIIKVIENIDQQNQNESFSNRQLVSQELEFKQTKSDSKARTEASASNDPMIDDMNLKIEKQISNAGTKETNMIKENKESQVNNIDKATGKISDTLNTKEYKQKEFTSSVQNKNAQEYNDELLKNASERTDHKNSGYRDTTRLIIEDSSDNSLHKEKKRSNEKDRTTFIDYNLQDYSSDLLRPPSYIPKSSSSSYNDETLFYKTDKAPIIYKAQSLLQESQLRSTTPQPPLVSSEKLSRIRQRSKPLSECDSSILSERRSGTSRDLKKRPSFSTFLTDRTAVEGSRVKLTCSVLSSSEPTVTWYKNGVALNNKQKYRSKYTDGLITLEVLNAVPTDSAEYKCTVANENGSITTSANLKVYPSFEASPIPPTFTRSIKDTYHLAENELVLECRIRGQPLPTITWLKDQVPISSQDRYHPCYLADGVCRLVIDSPCPADSGIYTCKAENSMWSDQITHTVQFTGRESQTDMNITTLEKSRFHRQVLESRRPHFTNVLSDYKVSRGGTIGLQVEIRGSPTRVEWLREGRSVVDTYKNAQTYIDQETYTLALSDVTEKDSGLFTCRAWSSYGNVDMNASVTVVQPAEIEGKPAIIVSRPAKDIQISVGEDVNISFRVQGEPKPKVVIMKGIRDITNSQRVCKMVSDDYVKFTLKRSIISDAGTYCILARNAYGCDRAFVTVEVRQRASSDNLISDWTYPNEEATSSTVERNYKSVPDRIPGEPSVVDGGNNWVSLAWPKSDHEVKAPVLAYKVESWLLGKEGGARWTELGITPRNTFDAFNLKQGEEYHFRVTPRNRYGWGEPVQTSRAISIGLSGERPEFVDILPGQLKVLVGESATLSCSFKGKPTPEIVWMKNGHEIDEEADRVKITPGGESSSLKIEDVRLEDEGRYSCEATNAHGRASTYARMTVITDKQVWAADAKLKRERSAGVEGDYPPQFTMRLRDRRVQATYPVRLTCQVIGSPPPTVTWFKNGELVIVDGRHSTSQDEFFYTLEIAPTNLDDGGVYEAMARNGRGAISCRCSLVVDKGIRAYVAPEFCCGLEPLYRLKEGEELRIAAMVEAYPSVGVAWYRDGVRLRPSRRAIMTLDRDGQIELAVASVTSRDAGVYSCTASNEVGSATTSGKVEVIEGEGGDKTRTPPVVISPDVPYSKEPMFIRKPRSSEAYEGDTVIIECEVIGDPKPDVYWLRDFLKPDYYRDAIHFKRVGGGPEYRLEIPHAKLDFTGAYSVVARNVHGEAKAIISLQILAKDPSSSDDAHNVRYGRVDVIPRFDKELTDLLCHDGDTVEFECHVSGNPEPDIKWFHYNEIIPDGTEFEATYEVGAARLRIRQVAAEDEGTYTCQATNTLGKATSSACLVVYPPGEPNTLSQRLRRPPALLSAASTPRSTPRTTPARSASRTPGPEARRLRSPARDTAPNFYTYPFNKVVEEGETVVFKCAVKGLPTPWATWDKDGIPLTPTARISIKEKDEMLRILEIEEVTIEDVGLYRITLENDYGRVEASARLEVITHRGKFYGSTRSYSPSPRRSLPFRRRTPSLSRYD